MAVTINGIVCQELVDGYTENYDIVGGPACRKGYLCNWSDRFTVIHGILGLSSTSSLGGLITLKVPLAYPELAAESTNALASQYARSCEVYGVGPPVQGASNISFTKARIYVTFGPYPWSFTGLDYFQLDPLHPYIWIEQHIDFSAEFITVPGSSVYVNPGGGGRIALDAAGQSDWGFFSPLMDMTLTLKNIPYLPTAAILGAMQAPINSTNYLQCNPGFLMFKGGADDRTAASDGTLTASTTYGFSYRPVATWDSVYVRGAWLQVTDNAGAAVIPRSDLSTIIPAAYAI